MQVTNDTLSIGVSEALVVYQQWSGTVNTLWSFFSTVALGVIGVVYRAELRGRVATLVTFGFLLFAIGNSCGIRNAQEIVEAASTRVQQLDAARARGQQLCHEDTRWENVKDAIPIFSDSLESLECEIDAQSTRNLQLLHLGLTATVLFALLPFWGVEWQWLPHNARRLLGLTQSQDPPDPQPARDRGGGNR